METFRHVNLDSDDEDDDGPKWDVFEDPPREPKVGSVVKNNFLDNGIYFLKIFTICLVFCMVLGASIVSKGTLLFMTSQIKKSVTRPYCNNNLDKNLQYKITLSDEERGTWIWYLIFAYFVPEFGTFFRSVRKCLYKTWKMPTFSDFLFIPVIEIAQAVGSAILVFEILPQLDVVKGAMLTNAVCFIPCVVGLFSRDPCKPNDTFKMTLDILSLVAQATSFVIWPLIEDNRSMYLIPVAVVLISLGWWENFLARESKLPFIRKMATARREFKNDLYFLYAFIAPVKCGVFLGTAAIIFDYEDTYIAKYFYSAFEDRQLWVAEIEPIIRDTISNINETVANGRGTYISTSYLTPIWVWLINVLSTYVCYAFGKFSCKIMIQELGFAFPINVAVPTLISGLIAMCGMFTRDECAFDGIIPTYLFFNSPPLYYLDDFISQQHAYIWLVWLLSQAWITIHIWSPNCDKLASTEQLFVKPMYDAFLIDQSLAMIRRRDESPKVVLEDNKAKDLLKEKIDVDDDRVTRIFCCGTMWHETKEEMLEFLKSIVRLDRDQSAHSLVRTEFKVHLSNYYELETHVFFDDAFVRESKDSEPLLNEYVESLVSCMDEAASKVHKTSLQLPPPVKYATPYGGRLVWALPGGTPFVVHLKDKKKIRAKKRWSQCMYMYYLLGHRLVCNDQLTPTQKDLRAENTYLLALDGDIDFQPDALHLLVDYMKKNKTLGAACGRIHPVGSGGMAWYQVFEYAVGHWLQKATEHVIGCVLCSPGCFSLFRGQALMDKSVMKKYTTRATEAKHFVQYDQGEDRWLCTLLLQRGYRVEYSAASDAYTHCPEGFNEFYNQRRRWMPSTIANIMDLLGDYEHTLKINDNISMIYIFYTFILLIGTIIGPGSIYLMLVGAFVAVFGLEQWASFYWNLAPILIFVIVCATCSSDIQLFFAGLISAVYGLVMMAVFVGVMLQISEDGWLAPSSLFFFCMAAEFIIAGILHPKEFNCLPYGIVYYVTVPSMYMLLVIYSVFNMNNVSWGTRDVTVVAKKQENKGAVENEPKPEAKQTTKDKVFSFLGANTADNTGAIEFGFNKLFKCMFCTYNEDSKEDQQLKIIEKQLEALNKKLDKLEKKTEIGGSVVSSPIRTPKPKKEGVSFDFTKNEEKSSDTASLSSEEVCETAWLYSECLDRGEVRFLDKKETTFWQEVLGEYLEPIEDDKEKVSADLKDLRDKMVFTFFMLNSLYVLTIFLLTLKKDLLHLNWPIDPKINFTYVPDLNEVHLYKEFLQLEPIGFVFLIFFGLLLIIQFIAMLIHRFGTFSQIMANTQIDIDWCSNKKDVNSDDIRSNPLRRAYELQELQGINDQNNDEELELPVTHRKTISQLIENRPRKSEKIFTLKSAFEKRLNDDDDSLNDATRKSIAVVRQRRKTIQRLSVAPLQNPFAAEANRPPLSPVSFDGANNYGFENEEVDI